jgi:hypothetical protein
MPISDDEFRAHVKRIDDLEKTLERSQELTREMHEVLSGHLGKVSNMALLHEDLLTRAFNALETMDKHHRGHNEEFEVLFNAYDMIMTHIENLEEKVFPNLSRDLRKLQRVIGKDESILHNPLDRRKEQPPKND